MHNKKTEAVIVPYNAANELAESGPNRSVCASSPANCWIVVILLLVSGLLGSINHIVSIVARMSAQIVEGVCVCVCVYVCASVRVYVLKGGGGRGGGQ